MELGLFPFFVTTQIRIPYIIYNFSKCRKIQNFTKFYYDKFPVNVWRQHGELGFGKFFAES